MVGHQQIGIPSAAALVNVALFAATPAIIVGLWSSTSLAFGGCVISPENPSFILALLGGAVAALPLLRARLKSRMRK
jgi:hypothetical protein